MNEKNFLIILNFNRNIILVSGFGQEITYVSGHARMGKVNGKDSDRCSKRAILKKKKKMSVAGDRS